MALPRPRAVPPLLPMRGGVVNHHTARIDRAPPVILDLMSSCVRGQRAQGIGHTAALLLLLRLQQLLTLLEDPEDRLRWAGIQAEPATFQATGGVELIWRCGEPGAGRADGDADGLVGATVGVADEVITHDHHGFDSFEETLREDLKHVFVRETAHGHSFTRAFSRSFNSGIWSTLF